MLYRLSKKQCPFARYLWVLFVVTGIILSLGFTDFPDNFIERLFFSLQNQYRLTTLVVSELKCIFL